MKTVAFDTGPLLTGHSLRGVGFYAKKLSEYFQKTTLKENLKIIFFKNGLIPREADLVHYPYFDPFFLTLPLLKKKKTIVTVHDLIPLIFPDKYRRGIRGQIKWQIQKSALKNVSAIITDSNNSKKDIIKIIGYPKDKIFSIYLAPDEIYKRLENGTWKLEITKKYNLPEKFILYVGDVNYNKNVVGLIKAFKNVKCSAKGGSNVKSKTKILNLKLVLIGGAFLNNKLTETKEINNLIDNLDLKKDIIMPGQITDEDLVKFYNLASVYIQPSFYEGFGLPVLEAMACGCPVICAKISSLPEIGGQAVLYCNPKDTEDIAKQMATMLKNPELRSNFIKRGYKQGQQFSWRKTIEQTIDVYQKILENE